MDPNRSLTRRQFDEVIRRAAEIAASEPEGGESDLNEEELFRIAREVGLEERHVKKALVQVRSAPPPGRNPVSSLFGPPTVFASRIVPGSITTLAKTIDEFMVAGRLLQAVRKGTSVLQYRPAVDWASQIARAASSTSKRYYVASAKRVEVRLEEVDENHTLVELEVEAGTRDDYLAWGLIGGAGGGGGVGVGIVMAVVGTGGAAALGVALGIIAASGVFGGICWGSGYYHKKRLLEVRAEMEGIDRLETGEALEPPSPSWRRWVRRHFHGVAKELLGDSDGSGS